MRIADFHTEISPAVGDSHPGLRFATVIGIGLCQGELRHGLAQRARGDYAALLARRATTERRLAYAEDLFEAAGHVLPLTHQLAEALRGGFRVASPLVSALMRCELLHGALTGVQDADQIKGGIRLDCASSGGGGSHSSEVPTTAAARHLVVRDEQGPLACLFAGPSGRATISRGTVNAVFYVFDMRGLGSGFDQAVSYLGELLAPCCEQVHERIVIASA